MTTSERHVLLSSILDIIRATGKFTDSELTRINTDLNRTKGHEHLLDNCVIVAIIDDRLSLTDDTATMLREKLRFVDSILC
jgi:hypothetical protein